MYLRSRKARNWRFKTEDFTLFPKLAIELRLEIWRYTLPGPRKVGIKIRIKDTGFGVWIARESTLLRQWPFKFAMESREEAQKYYILSFGTTIYLPTVYFNYEIDTLCSGDGIENQNRLPKSIGAARLLAQSMAWKTLSPPRFQGI